MKSEELFEQLAEELGLPKIEQQISDVDGRCDDLESDKLDRVDFDDLESTVSDLELNVKELENKVEALETALEEVKTLLDSLVGE